MLTSMWINIKSHSFLVEMQNSADTSEDSLQFVTDLNMLFYMNQNHAPWYLSKKAEMSIQKFDHNVHSRFHNCQNLETTNTSFSMCVDKLWYIKKMEYYYIVPKRNELWSHRNTWRNL